MRGGRMIVNPVRYGSGGMVKTTTVSITTMVGEISTYCVQNGEVIHNPKNPFQADAGSMLVVIKLGTVINLSVSGATLVTTEGDDVSIYLVND